MKIDLPKHVTYILGQLENHGYEGYAVGGCIRDVCFGRTPNDWDICTSASPYEVKKIFPHTFDTGIQHGTITVLIEKEGYEVTTYRIDGEYTDSRHPVSVEFTSSLEEDLKRRDFTINAMAYNETNGLIDLFGGLDDLKRGVIRCVGNPEERFDEDALRMLRAVRFSAQLGFEIETQTADAIRRLAPALKQISAERIQTELVKLLESSHPSWIEKAWETGMTAVILPEFDRMMEQPQNSAHHIYSVGVHTMKALEAVPEDRVLRLTMLFHDIGKPKIAKLDEKGIYHFRGHAAVSAVMTAEILKRLKFDRSTSQKVLKLVANHSMYPQTSPEGVRRGIYQIGEELFPLFLEVKRADIYGQKPEIREEKLAYLQDIKEIYEEIVCRGDCVSLKTLALTGKDLIDDGMKPGKALGEILEKLLDDVLTEPSHNTKGYLLSRSRELR